MPWFEDLGEGSECGRGMAPAGGEFCCGDRARRTTQAGGVGRDSEADLETDGVPSAEIGSCPRACGSQGGMECVPMALTRLFAVCYQVHFVHSIFKVSR